MPRHRRPHPSRSGVSVVRIPRALRRGRAATSWSVVPLLVAATVVAGGPPAVPAAAPPAARAATQARSKLADADVQLPGGCSGSGAAVTCSYYAGGGVADLPIPVGATDVTFDVRGAKGGNGGGGDSSNGGSHGTGAEVTGTFANVAGETLHIGVGSQGALDQRGTNPIGFADFGGGGGGNGTDSGGKGGGGGAASVVYVGANITVVVAAGGGGGGGGDTHDGYTGSNGGAGSFRGDGSTTGGGGGDGGSSSGSGGGGGGGGYVGGNGGGGGGVFSRGDAGGGGENLVPDGGSATTGVDGDGSVVISYTRSPGQLGVVGPTSTVYAWQSGGLAIPVTVAGGATGTVTATAPGYPGDVCDVTLVDAAGTCTVPAAALTAGTVALQFDYSGDAGFTSDAQSMPVVVTPDQTTTSVIQTRQRDGSYEIDATSAAVEGITDGTLSVSSSPSIPGFADACRPQTAPASTATQPNTTKLQLTCTLTVPPGSYTVTANFAGTSNDQSSSDHTTLKADKYAAPTVSLAFSSQVLAAYGDTTTATVTVTGSSGATATPSGPVTVAPATGSGTPCPAATPNSTSGDTATYVCTVTPGGGTSTWRASFAGDANYQPGASDPTAVTASVTVAAATPDIRLITNQSSMTAGQTLELDVVATNPHSALGIATGTLTFWDGPVGQGQDLGTVAASTASLRFVPPAGTHHYYVHFDDGLGGADYTATDAGPTTVTVAALKHQIATSVAATPSGATAAGIPVTVTTTLQVDPADTQEQPVTLEPAPATACTSSEKTSSDWRTITVVCSYLETPGSIVAFAPTYTDPLVGSLQPAATRFTVPASPTTVTATAPDVTYGSPVVVTATVVPTVTGARVSGTVTVTEGAAVCTTTVAPTDHAVTCAVAGLHVGTHHLSVQYTPDTSASAATATSPVVVATVGVAAAPASIALGPPTATAGANPTLTVTATATSQNGGAPATGTVTFGGATGSCGTVGVVAGTASCTVPLPAPGTEATISVTYTPSGDFTAGATTTASTTFQRASSGSCTGGFAALWKQLQGRHGAVALDAGALGSVSVTVPQALGDCDTAAVLGVTGAVSLFQGTVQANPLAATITSTALCLDRGDQLALPSIWKSGALDVTAPVCFPFTASGGVGVPTGTLAVSNSGGNGPPLLSLPGVTGAAALTATLGTACPGASVGAGSCAAATPAVTVAATVAATSSAPGVTVTATVRTDGSLDGTVAITPVSLLGTSVVLAGSVSRAGTGALAVQVGATTASSATPAPGLTLEPGATVTLTGGTSSTPTLTADGTVQVGAGTSAALPVAVHGQISALGDYSLTLASTAPAPTWTPLSGLTITPVLAGSLTHDATGSRFSLSATGVGGAPLGTWSAPGGVTVSVAGVSIGGDPTVVDPGCSFTAGGGSVLALRGSLTVGALTVAAAGCVDLTSAAVAGGATDRSWHLDATAGTATLGRLALSAVELAVTHTAGSDTELQGTAQATVSVGSFTQTATVTMSDVGSVLVVGGHLDGSGLGFGSAYLAYASAAKPGWQTGVTPLGAAGVVDLPAGVTLFGSLAVPSGALAALQQAGFALPAGAVLTFQATVPTSGGSLSFSADLADPAGIPLLTLPSASLSSASVTYDGHTFGLVADGSVTGQDGVAAPVHLQVTISGDGSLSGTASVTGLGLFGRTVTLTGAVSRTAAGKLTVALTAALTGTIPLGGATLSDVTVAVGTGGLSASGTLSVASTQLGFTVSFVSTSVYALTVDTTVTGWSPTPGVTVNAAVDGSLTRTPTATTYDFAVTPVGGGTTLLTLSPAPGVALGLDSFELSNRPTAPATCTLGAVGDSWLAVSGSLAVAFGGANGSGTGTGCFDLTHPAFSITVVVPGAGFGGGGGRISLSGLTVTVTGDAHGTFTAQGAARLSVQMPSGGQFSLLATLTLGANGFAIGGVADLASYLGSSAADAYLFYATAAMSVDTGDPTVGTLALTPGITVGLAVQVSDGMATALHTVGVDVGSGSKLAATVHLDLTNATVVLDIAVAFQQTYVFREDNGTSLRIDSLTLAMTLSPTQPSFAFQVAGTLHVPASVPGGSASDVALNGAISIGTQLSVYLSVTNWNDALGIPGLDLASFTLQGGITLTGLPLPSLAVEATVTGLPSALANVIGYQQGAPVTLALAIGETNLLVDVSIGTPGSTTPVLSPFHFVGRDSLLSVDYAQLYLSPTGATIGSTVYPAGFSLAFDGTIFGVSVNVSLQVNPAAMSLNFTGTIGTINVGSLVMGPTTLTIAVSPHNFELAFSGHISAGPSTSQIGPLLRVGGSLQADVSLAVDTDGISAHGDFAASVYTSDYVAQHWCKQGGIWVLCDYQWVDTPPLSVSLTNLGFDVNSSGLTVDIPNTANHITIAWPKSPLSAQERQLGASAGAGAGIQTLTVPGTSPRPAVAAAPTSPPAATIAWQPTGGLGEGRAVPATVRLRDGSVLTVGGASGGQALASTEIYRPSTGGWQAVAPMHTARIDPAVAELADGRVLVAGGDTGSSETATAEIYDPSSNRWSGAGSLSVARQAATAAVLPDGSVLVAGGHVEGVPSTVVDRFDPGSGSWSVGASLPSARAAAAGTVLADGDVLLAGGMGAAGPLNTVVRYHDGSWVSVAPMADARFYASATPLADGDVLVAGGVSEAELYHPATDRWSPAGMLSEPVALASTAVLPSGDVLVLGGLDQTGAVSEVDRYSPSANRWTPQTALPSSRAGAASAVLTNGGVLVAGGFAGTDTRDDAFVYAASGAQVRVTGFGARSGDVGGSGSGAAAAVSSVHSWWTLPLGGVVVVLLAGAALVIVHRRRRADPPMV